MNKLVCCRAAAALKFLTVAGVFCALSTAAFGQADTGNKAPGAPAKIVNPHRLAPGSGGGAGPVPVGGVCAAFNPATDCQTSSFFIAYNISDFRTADAISARVPVSSICLQGIYFNNVPVRDHWALTVYNDGGGVPGTVLDTFTEGVDLVANGPAATGRDFVDRAVQEWNLVLARPVDHHGACLWYEFRNNAEGDMVFVLDGDGFDRIFNGNLQAAQDFDRDGVYERDAELLPDDLAICINGGFADNTRCFNNPCEGIVPSNDECASARVLRTGAPSFGTTLCAHADNVASCIGSFVGPAVWYSVTGTGHTMSVTLCGTATASDSVVEVYCGDCDHLVCVAGNDNGCILGSSAATFCTIAGDPYLVLVHGAFGFAEANFTISLFDDGVPCSARACTPCLGVTCPAGAIPEAEPCGANTNSGCAAGSHTFEAIVGNATICGTVFADGQQRDNDWYRVTAPASGRISATLTAGFTSFFTLVDLGTPPDPTCGTFILVDRASVVACGSETLVGAGLIPGNTYIVIVTPAAFADLPCANYFLSVDQGGQGAPCCDFNSDGALNSQDFFDFLASFFTNSPSADFNGDHTLNSQDFFDFITCFFSPPAGCP